MFDWLFEGHLSVYALLTAAAALFAVLGTRARDRRWFAAAAGVVALAVLYCLLDSAVETDREQIQRKVKAMAAGLKAPANLDAVLENVSDQFHCPFAESKSALRDKARDAIQTYKITEVRISDLHCGDISRERSTAVAEFRAKVIGTFGSLEAAPVICKAKFDYEPQPGWRLRELEVHGEGPLQGIEMP